MARQLVVLALVLIFFTGVVSIDASSAGGSLASAPAGASTGGSAASSSPTSQPTTPSLTGDIPIDDPQNCCEGNADKSLNKLPFKNRVGFWQKNK
ncbi:hypothetical protein ES288_D10G020900v1 [Gossypium darwinii]|uniref:Uncharacterized protein n=1 Tax=Gossypium darwinii TaxID=34276 RepID=A0A5D2AU85_GOSDA|nr:hypothetical protein ES288_D10G020900v1 [Gossypium darwinii]